MADRGRRWLSILRRSRAQADGYWSASTCRAGCSWLGYPGQGAYYSSSHGTHWVGAAHAAYASLGYECGRLDVPVKDYGWVGEFSAFGQWFLGGVLFYRSGYWWVSYGNFGQAGIAHHAVPVQVLEAPEPPKVERPPKRPKQ